MKLFAALIVIFMPLAAPLQAQYNLSVDEMIDRRMSGEPILDPKLALLIRDVEQANWEAVDYHNEKLKPRFNESTYTSILDNGWYLAHREMVSEWTKWDDFRLTWYRKKRVEASAAQPGVVKIRNMETIELQKKTIEAWEGTKRKINELDEKKGLIEDLDGLGKLWSGWVSKVDKLNKAITALRKY